MQLGAHVSSAGKLHLAFERAQKLEAECLQIFTRAPSQWANRPLKEVDEFRRLHQAHGALPLFAHDLYLTNLAAANDEIRQRSIQSQIDEMRRCEQLGVQGLVCHMGSNPDPEVGLQRLSDGIAQVLAESPTTVELLLETTAGQGNCLGHRFEQLAFCLERNPRLGVCLDTCHILAGGYDLTTDEGYAATWNDFARLLGMDKLRLLHLNDSQKPLGSRVDRHHHIGQGAVGLEGFRRLINDPKLAHLPAVIETPEGETMHRENLDALKRLRK
jgi:deoxyribonuclease-4